MKAILRRFVSGGLLPCLLLVPALCAAEEGEAQPAPYDLVSMECGELDNEAGLLPLRPSHTAGEDLDLLCKVRVQLPATAKGAPKAHTVTFSVFQNKKTTYQQVRDVRLLSPGARTILFVVPAEKLPTEGGKVRVRAELSKPASKPGFKEITYELNAED
jgi:hypothetical protein